MCVCVSVSCCCVKAVTESPPPPVVCSLSMRIWPSMARRSFACACDNGGEARLRGALPLAETGVGAHSGGGESGLLLVGWRWPPAGGGEGKRRRWRRRKPAGAGSWPLMRGRMMWASAGNCCLPWVVAAVVSGSAGWRCRRRLQRRCGPAVGAARSLGGGTGHCSRCSRTCGGGRALDEACIVPLQRNAS